MWLVSYKMGSISSTNNPSSAMYELILWPSFACLPLDFQRRGTAAKVSILWSFRCYRCCFVALASASVFLFVVAFLLKFLSLSLSPFFLCSCLSVTKQKKAKEMHLITQSAVMLLSLLSHLSGQHCVALSPPTLLSHSHSLTPFAAERKKERESESELACRTHGQWVQREEGVQWRGLSETDSDTLHALLQKPRLFGECNVRVRKKNQFK